MSEETKPTHDESSVWSWPDSLNALQAAPRHHQLILENERVRVFDTRIGPGETVPVHTHRWPAVFHVMSWRDFVRRDANGKLLLDTRGRPPPEKLPFLMWSDALPPNSLENVGAGEIHLVSIEQKDVR